jgi:hypothetical protein
MYLSVNQTYSKSDSQLAKIERNDCVVRSIASAANVAYDIAHIFCKEVFKRENKKGVNGYMIKAQMLKAEDKGLTVGNKNFNVSVLGKGDIKNKYKVKGEVIWRQKTLKSFIETHPKGTYLVTVAKHALTIKDGELLDWGSNKFLPTRKVQAAYKLDSTTKEGIQLSFNF